MPTRIDEGELRFEFSDFWPVVQKYDDHRDYRQMIHKLQGTSALDIVAIQGEAGPLFLIEIKDYRGSRIEHQAEITNGELAAEIGRNVRDTIAGIIAAHHRGHIEDWGAVVGRMISPEPPIRVLLWLENEFPTGPRGRRANQLSVLTDTLKRQLHWLTPRVLVVGSTLGGSPEGLTVTNLPGSSRRD